MRWARLFLDAMKLETRGGLKRTVVARETFKVQVPSN
jgi:hypothetical protein